MISFFSKNRCLLVILFAIFGIGLKANDLQATTLERPIFIIPLQTNLAAWWTFNGPDIGPNIRDKSGNGVHANLSVNGSATTTSPGKQGQAIYLDGVNDFVTTSASVSNVQTLSFWVDISTSTAQSIIALNGSINVTVAANGAVSANGFADPTIYIDGNVGTTIDRNWHLITITTGTSFTADAITIGKVGSVTCGCMIDDVRLYTKVLAAEDVKSLARVATSTLQNLTLAGPENLRNGLVAYWTFDGKHTSGTSTANDIVGSFTGTTQNFTVAATTSNNTASGTRTWTAPTGVEGVKVELWGGGGGGGGSGLTQDFVGGGGAGGSYSRVDMYPVTPGSSYTYYVGRGGAGGSTSATGTPGENSMFVSSSTMWAAGGMPGGLGGATDGVNGVGGAATTTKSIGDVTFFGGAGGNGTKGTESGGGGGGAGSTQNGTAASGDTNGTGGTAGGGNGALGRQVTNANALPGIGGQVYGGGGSGGAADGNTNNAGAIGGFGAMGRVTVVGYYMGNKWSLGKIGQAAEFDAMTGSVAIGTGPTNVRTISFWMYTATSTNARIFELTGSINAAAVSGTITLTGFGPGTNIYVDGAVGTTIGAKRWHMITISTTTDINASAMNIGKIGTGFYGGKIDDFRIYSRTLSTAEVAQLYELGAGTKQNISLVGPLNLNNILTWWTMDGPHITTNVRDRGSAGAHLNLSLSGSATSTAPGKYGQALALDGVNDFASSTLNVSGIQTVSFWVKLSTTTTSSMVQLANSVNIVSSSGAVAANGFSTPTIYVNGVTPAGTIDTKRWHHITVTTATPINGTAILIGKRDTISCGCNIDDVRFYSRALSAAEILQLYDMAY